MNSTGASSTWRIAVGLGSCGIAAGAMKLYKHLETHLPPGVVLKKTGCAGLCHREPMLELYEPGGKRWTYVELSIEALSKILTQHIGEGQPVDEYLLDRGERAEQTHAYLGKQKRIVLENCGLIDPESIDDYLAVQGYEALKKVLNEYTPQALISLILESGLRGRGGAGFLTGAKWKFTQEAKGTPKYIICNGDEGDPGAFMDRSVLESDPHRVLEGMLIGAYAIGASRGFLYVRAEYPLALKHLKTAISQARERGFLGQNILGTKFCCDFEIREGAGAFVCGEETALIASIQGERGTPRIRPPFPAVQGLFKQPTTINNVETLANVPWIVRHGAAAFNSLGTEKSKGTKVFALAGKIKRGGLIEVPMGITLREVIEGIGGGSSSGKPLKAVQTGGPSGGCIPVQLFDTPIDYDELAKTGAIMGSGGMVVMDQDACMVDAARFFLTFTKSESCGKCTFCRIGTQRMLEILTRITAGKAAPGDLELLEELANAVRSASLCGLGQTAPNPVLTTVRYFRSEYEAHITEKRCPAKACKALLRYNIVSEKCIGCGACMRACPSRAISGERRQAHTINQETCVRCGACLEACRFDAISVQ
ncbi:MAG: NADH-quinone oxidoreductase subunit NuoF [Deltaproteobacteria bacterium]|nr:NADH-quinone oxidoreductase subunit NuoF [Deltaproteobacteria bacterium]